MAYIKSHSNYVLKTLHQTTRGGNIWERDITTIGGVDSFTPGQIPVYKSGNFIITVNNEDAPSRSIGGIEWANNKNSGNTWTLDAIDGIVKNEQEDDTQIVLKRDYYDLKDFAYYGSCYELVRASITDIINRFPGELYAGERAENANHYTTNVIGTGDKAVTLPFGKRIAKNRSGKYLVDVTYLKDDGTITEESKAIKKTGVTMSAIKDDWIVYNIEPSISGETDLFILDNPFGINLHSNRIDENDKSINKLRYFANRGYENYEVILDGETSGRPITDFSEYVIDDKCFNIGDLITFNKESKSTITIGGIEVYCYMGENSAIVYATKTKGVHIRPKQEYLTKFYKSLDQFQNVILNPNTNPKYKSSFIITKENQYGYYNEFEDFTFPLGKGGYNISVENEQYNSFLGKLIEVASFYDETFCDNLYRSMTPESMKTFDYTRTDDGLEDEYTIGGDRIKNTLRVWGREFDEIKSYIDGLLHINDITYDNRSNTPNYFLTDMLEKDGWDPRLVYPFDVSRFTLNNGIKTTISDVNSNWTETIDNVKNGKYNEFSTLTSGSCYPYLTSEENFIGNFGDGNEVPTNGTITVSDCGAIKFIKRKYTSDKKYTYTECNNELLRRMKLNSKAIARAKGTIDGVEMILSLFGLKSDKWAKKYPEYTPDYKIVEYSVHVNPLQDELKNNGAFKIDDYNYKKITIDDPYVPYQGLPVSYVQPEDNKRLLYPNFEKYEKYDGNLYFQMNGGWKNKTIDNKDVLFDNDGNIMSSGGKTYIETLRNIRNVSTIAELFQQPYDRLEDNVVYYVYNTKSTNYALLNGYPYELKSDTDGGNVSYYVELVVKGHKISIQGDYPISFSDKLTVLDKNLGKNEYSISELPDGYVIKAYYDKDKNSFVMERTLNGNDGISYFDVFIDGKTPKVCNSTPTHYFQMNNLCFGANTMFSSQDNEPGWKQLTENDYEYLRMSSILDYYKGNNPHNGKFSYDSGEKYLKYYDRLFGYSIDNDKFDERCFNDYNNELKEIEKVGFDILENTTIDSVLKKDRKVNAFVDFYDNDGNYYKYRSKDKETQYIDGDNRDKSAEPYIENKYQNVSNVNELYTYGYTKERSKTYEFSHAKIGDINVMKTNGFVSNDCIVSNIDPYTSNQYMNVKNINIEFTLKSAKGTKDRLEELFYFDKIVMHYVEQMIPSNAILSVSYK